MMGVIGTFHPPPSPFQLFSVTDGVIFYDSVQLQPTGATGTSGGDVRCKESIPPLNNNTRGSEQARFPKDSLGEIREKILRFYWILLFIVFTLHLGVFAPANARCQVSARSFHL